MTGWVNTSKAVGNHDCVLHTDPSCQHVTEHSLPAEKAYVDLDALDECDYCAGTMPRSEEQAKTCPFCNERVGKLPDHLPCEESP